MKILIVSDTHGKENNLLEAVKLEKPLDFIVHLGDLGKLEEYIEELTGYPCFAVRGNNDWSSLLPAESIIMIGKYRTFITHGHHYGVNYSTKELTRHARNLDCSVVMYGHTHIPELTKSNGLTCLCPGSISLPRQAGRQPSYAIAEVDDSGEAAFTIKYLSR